MPLWNDSPEKENLHKTAKELEMVIYTESDVGQAAITNNISGYKWEVNFYTQILGNGDEPKQPDKLLNITLQSYRLIENAEIILTSPLSAANEDNLGGECYINIGSAIHQYDIIIAKVHNNKTAIFLVDEVTYDTYEDNNIFKVTFKLFGYSHDKATYESIINKVATNYVYNKEYKLSNQSPIILKKDAFNFDYGMSTIKTIMRSYFNKYYDKKLNFIVVDDKDGKMLDPYLNDFIIKAFSSMEYDVLMDINKMVGDRSNDLTLFDGLFTNVKFTTLDKLGSSTPNLYYNSVFFKNVMKVAYSVGKDNFKSYFDQGQYFVSDIFYKGESQDEFEILLYNFIKDKTIVPEDIGKFIDNIDYTEKRLDCYKIPILCFIYSVYLWKSK